MNKYVLAVITAITAAAIMVARVAAPAPAAKPTQVVAEPTPTQVVAEPTPTQGFEFEGVIFTGADLKSLARSEVRRDKAREDLIFDLKEKGCFTYGCVIVQPGYGFDKWSSVKVNGNSENLVRGDAVIEYEDGGYNQGPVDESIRTIQVKASTLKEKDTSMYLKLVVLNSYGDPLFIEGPVDEVVEAALHL